MKNFKLIISYDGTNYFGWQKTASGPSVQQTLETIFGSTVEAASRTDRGVHAQGQVVQFCADKLIKGPLPKDISIRSIEEVPFDFHPTLDAKGKEYHYYICASAVQLPHHRYFSWHFPYPLNIEVMQREAIALIGLHDFSAFCNNEIPPNPLREIFSIDIIPLSDKRVKISIKGNSFLYKMVRNIAGTLAYIGANKLQLPLSGILQSKHRPFAGPTAPAHGLTLYQVFY